MQLSTLCEDQDQAQNMFRALWCWLVCVIETVVARLLTKPDSELTRSGLRSETEVIQWPSSRE